MTLEEIKQAVESGKVVHWCSSAYKVAKDDVGQWLILCDINSYCIGLTWRDGVTMNGHERDFYTL